MKTVLITGATEGIGKATAIGLAQAGFTVILHGRDEIKTKAVQKELEALTGKSVFEYVIADLSSLDAVAAMAAQVKAGHSSLDVLVNNAGMMSPDKKRSADGYELNFAVNYLSHVLLTRLLFDLLKAAPQGRVLNLSSGLYSSAKPDAANLTADRPYSMMTDYNTSKLYNIYFTKALAIFTKGTNITSYAIIPGVVNTKLARDFRGVMKVVFAFFTKYVFVSPEKGAATSVFVATTAGLTNGATFENKKPVTLKAIALNTADQTALWKNTETLLKKYIA